LNRFATVRTTSPASSRRDLVARLPRLTRALIYGSLVAAVLVMFYLRLLYPAGRTFHFIYLADAFVHGTFAVDNLPAYYQDKLIVNNYTYYYSETSYDSETSRT
jgi:hypothetical protein